MQVYFFASTAGLGADLATTFCLPVLAVFFGLLSPMVRASSMAAIRWNICMLVASRTVVTRAICLKGSVTEGEDVASQGLLPKGNRNGWRNGMTCPAVLEDAVAGRRDRLAPFGPTRTSDLSEDDRLEIDLSRR